MPLVEHILVVDDEPMVRDVVQRYLTADGFTVEGAADGNTALAAMRSRAFDLIILDVMLPGLDGLSVLRRMRAFSDVPVILLTARGEEIDRIGGLEDGADDYVVKPFSPRELVARVRSVLRRVAPAAGAAPLVFGILAIDPGTREVTVDGQVVELTRREFDLLLFLASWPRQVFSRGQLLEKVWQSSAEWQDPSTVTVHVRRLRSKLEPDPDAPHWITTAWGVGYRFDP